jgi:hypothetical protein
LPSSGASSDFQPNSGSSSILHGAILGQATLI